MENDRKISEAAENARKGVGSKDLSMEAEQTAWLTAHGVPTTISDSKYTWHVAPSAAIVGVFLGRGGLTAGFLEKNAVVTAEDGLVGVILNETSFYYESGGQTYDTGYLELADGTRFEVTNAQTYAGYVVHVGIVSGSGSLRVDDSITIHVDYDRRGFVAPNHTMTHVLNYALKSVLVLGDATGTGSSEGKAASEGLSWCDQKGSLVDEEKLRFDFSWSGALTPIQVKQVEDIVNQRIQQSLPVHAKVVPLVQATQVYGLRQVFGERYPDPVRVISVGPEVDELVNDPSNKSWSGYSIEFCGGTHLTNTAQAEDFVIVEETGIAKGIRRIVGFTRKAAKQARQLASEVIDRLQALTTLPGGVELSVAYKTIKVEVDQSVVSLVDKDRMRSLLDRIYETIRSYHKASLGMKIAEATVTAEQVALEAHARGEETLVLSLDIGADGKVAKKILEKIKAVYPVASVFIASMDEDEEKIGVYPAVSEAHQARGLSAKSWLDYCVHASGGGGKGGGKVDQANGSFPVTPSLTIDVLLGYAHKYLKDTLK